MRTAGVVVLGLWVMSCAPLEEQPSSEARADAIIGGTPTGQADPEVFALLDFGPFCSSTLIHPRVLLTAAHCVRSTFSYVTHDPSGSWDNSPYVASTWAHPNYATTGLEEYDVALVLLQAPITSVRPKAIRRTALPSTLGPGRAVGYGQRSVTGTRPPSGERYTIDLPVTAVTQGQVRYGSPGAAICFGDSGGPFFEPFGGVETLVAVHSYTNDPTCSGGAGARVDKQMPLIESWFATNVCPRDGACDPDCLAEDFDCACGADGQCTAACTRPELDVDCPANCGADGVCAALACPIPDVDCRAAGAPCERANQCVGQRCTSDPQHPDTYCSMPCTAVADCAGLDQSECVQGTCRFRQVAELAEGAECRQGDRCAAGTRCHLREPTRAFCSKPCSRDADCAQGMQCRYGLSSWQACAPRLVPPVTIESVSTIELPGAPSGCSTSGSMIMFSLAVLLARRVRTGRCHRRAAQGSRTCAAASH